MTMLLDEVSLKILVDDTGQVWYADRYEPPCSTGLDYPTWVRQEGLRRARHVRLIGSRSNAHLVCDLARRQLRGDLETVQVCSPVVVAGVVRLNPEAVLYALRGWGSVPSLGGWHCLEPSELLNYRLAVLLQQPAVSPTSVLELVRQHPLYRPLSFFQGLDEQALAQLFSEILDPRWHVDVTDPDSSWPLERFVGLRGPVTEATLQRRKLVADCWRGALQVPKDQPGAYFARCSFCLSPETKFLPSMRFLRILRALWLDQVSSSHRGRLVRVEDLFDEPDTAQAFGRHLQTL